MTPWLFLSHFGFNSVAKPNSFIGMASPLSTAEIAYQALQPESVDAGRVFST